MAKKTTPKQTGEITVIKTPEVFLPALQKFGLESHPKLPVILAKFTPHYYDLVELEKEFKKLNLIEPSPEDVKQIIEVRKKYQKIRKASDDTKKAEKEEALKEGRICDGLNSTLTKSAEDREEKCSTAEKWAETKEAERVAAITAERKAILDQYDFDSDFVNLAEMEQAGFDKMVASAKKAYEADQLAEEVAEAERKKNEEVRERFAKLRLIGIADDSEFFAQQISEMNFVDFTAYYAAEKIKFDSAKIEKDLSDKIAADLAKEKQERITNRINAVTALGLTYNEKNVRYEGFDIFITKDVIETAELHQFQLMFSEIKKTVIHLRAEAETKRIASEAETKRLSDLETENKRKAKEAADEAAALLVAPDQVKYKEFYNRFCKMDLPVLQSPAGIEIMKEFMSYFNPLKKFLATESVKLK